MPFPMQEIPVVFCILSPYCVMVGAVVRPANYIYLLVDSVTRSTGNPPARRSSDRSLAEIGDSCGARVSPVFHAPLVQTGDVGDQDFHLVHHELQGGSKSGSLGGDGARPLSILIIEKFQELDTRFNRDEQCQLHAIRAIAGRVYYRQQAL